MGTLTGEDIPKLARKLDDTLDLGDLKRWVYASTGDQLFSAFVHKDQPMIPMIEELLIKLENLNSTPDFLAYVYVNRPGRKDVRKLITKYFPGATSVSDKTIDLSAQERGEPQSDAPKNAMAPGLQRNVKPNLHKLEIREWREKLVRVERQVCRVEADGSALGTGFLVGPGAVLTNWHVVEAAKKAGKADKLGCRFDYVRLSGGNTQAGQLVMVTAASPIDTSRYTAAEKAGDADKPPPPTPEELDYALLQVAAPVGEQIVEGIKRGWIGLPKVAQPLKADDPILIVQHPEGTPMKLALDTEAVIGLTGGGTRLRYRTNTEGGSSGSPVFTMDWDIVALHHYGDPKYRDPKSVDSFNQGIPIELIRGRIEKNGFAGLLGI